MLKDFEKSSKVLKTKVFIDPEAYNKKSKQKVFVYANILNSGYFNRFGINYRFWDATFQDPELEKEIEKKAKEFYEKQVYKMVKSGRKRKTRTKEEMVEYHQEVGKLIKSKIEDKIIELSLQPVTRRKGSNPPLVDTRELLNSIRAEVIIK